MEATEEELRRRLERFIVELRRNKKPQQADDVADKLLSCLEGEELREPPFCWSPAQKSAFKIGDTVVVFLGMQPPWYGQRLTLSRIQPDAGGITLHFTDEMADGGKGKVIGTVGWSRIDPRSVHSVDADEVFDEDES